METTYLHNIFRCWPLANHLDLCRIYENPFFRNYMSLEINFIQLKLTLRELGLELIIPQHLQNEPKMLFVLFSRLRANQNTIHENCDKLIKEFIKYAIYKIHKSRWCISQTERHNKKLIMFVASSKRYFWNV